MTDKIPVPTTDQLAAIAAQCRLSLSPADLVSFRELMVEPLRSYNTVDSLPDEYPQLRYERGRTYVPSAAENPYNAWYVKTEVLGATTGKLKGKRVALKDNVMLAGVPMMNGAATLEGYTPEFDATVVTRILDAGGDIVGKTSCEDLCLSAGSHTNAKGHVHNPHRLGFSAGGSSSGSAVVVALGEVDMAIGCDQGGSIRVPAALSGICGLKPTWGLVPYTGIMPLEPFIDHVGPMTSTVADNALLLEVIAGDDGIDPRGKSTQAPQYSACLQDGIRGAKIALVTEGFTQAGGEEVVNVAVRRAAAQLSALGAKVLEVSIPMHKLAMAISAPIGIDGLTQTLMWGDGYGTGRPDLFSLALIDRQRRWREQADRLGETTKLFMLLGTYIWNQYGPRYYAKAVNLARRLARAYDTVLQDHDLLLMPTSPMRAPPLPPLDADRATIIASGGGVNSNTQPFNLTHHPALSIPCGMADGLPIGMMLVGRPYREEDIYRIAFAFEQSGRWTEM